MPRQRRLASLPLFDASLVVLAALLVLTAAHQVVARREALRTYPPQLVVTSEVTKKADLLQKLHRQPKLIFFGGSRAERFDPAYARRKTHLPSFNLAVSNSHPESAWALLNWIYARHPKAQLRWIWAVSTSTFGKRALDPALLQDRRFSWYFSDALLRAQRPLLPQTVAEMPRHNALEKRRYAPDGLLLWNTYDHYREIGGTLGKSLDRYIASAVAKVKRADGSGSGNQRSRMYFEKSLRLLNDHDTTPVIVLMPVHPRVLAALAPYGRDVTQMQFLNYLHGLQTDYSLKIVDLTNLSSFHGDSSGFYDGVHIDRQNSDRVFDTLLKRAGAVLR